MTKPDLINTYPKSQTYRKYLIKNTGDSLCYRGCGVRGTLLFCWSECIFVWSLWKSVWWFLRKLEINLLQDPAISLLDIYPKDAQSYQKNICSTIFIAALFVIPRKQPRCPSVEECIRKMYTFTQWSTYSAVKKVLTSWNLQANGQT